MEAVYIRFIKKEVLIQRHHLEGTQYNIDGGWAFNHLIDYLKDNPEEIRITAHRLTTYVHVACKSLIE